MAGENDENQEKRVPGRKIIQSEVKVTMIQENALLFIRDRNLIS